MNSLYVNGANQTLSHEMGHVFELYHTFYDDAFETTCPRTDSCSFYGDRVCDTEGGPLMYICTTPTNSCTGLAYTIADPLKNYTVLNNYMNYTNCPWMFTAGQKERVRATLLAFRPGLINSGALKPTPSSSPAVACIPTAVNGQSFYYGLNEYSSIPLMCTPIPVQVIEAIILIVAAISVLHYIKDKATN
jgi:hypothetical protein